MDALPPFDPYGRVAPKLAFLAGLEPSDRVALIGERAEPWLEDFRALVGDARVITPAPDARALKPEQGLAVLAPGPTARPLDLRRLISTLRRGLTSRGLLLLLVQNRLAPRNAFRRSGDIGGTVFGIRRALRAERLDYGEFLAVPDPQRPEEFVRTGTPDAAAVAPGLMRRLRAGVRKRGWFYRSVLYAAWAPGAGLDAVVRDVAMGTGCGEQLAGARVARFDLRDRGALILLLEGDGGGAWVARVAAGPESVELMDHGTAWLHRLRRGSGLPEGQRGLIPRAVGAGRVRGQLTHVETRLQGIIAWRLASAPALEVRAFDGLYRFLVAFNDRAAETRVVDESLLGSLIAPAPLRDLPRLGEELEDHVAALVRILRSRLLGRSPVVVWGHGDFGYGNTLADPETGNCTGVIDWDTARETELAGVDLVNFLVQRHRIRYGTGLTPAFERVGEALLRGGFRAVDARLDYGERFGLDALTLGATLGLALLRFVQRDTRYPSVFARGRGDLAAAAAWCAGALAEGAG